MLHILAANAQWDEEKGWLGHTNIHVTLDTYADVFDRMNLGAISKFEDYMDKVLQGEE